MNGTFTNGAHHVHSYDEEIAPLQYRPHQLHNFRKIPHVEEHLDEEQMFDVEVVGSVFPFKTNNYVVEQLIDWSKVPDDPMYVLNFPQRGMLKPEHFAKMASCMRETTDRKVRERVANEIRHELNPHPAGQLEHNVPELYGEKFAGTQHKYNETILFFPSQGQTCHAYCSFCFRWPQFVNMDEDVKFATKEIDSLVDYLGEHPEVSDVLFTGGDPMVMSPKLIDTYFRPLIEADLPSLKTIRIGSKSLTYWPYKYVNDHGHEHVLQTFQDVVESGKQLAFMAHFNHPVELSTPAVQRAIHNIRQTGAVIRSQTPLLKNINDDAEVWARKWRTETNLGVVPYYMFVVRDTGAQEYFGVPLVRSWEIFREAYKQVSGLCRTVRGPSMSAEPGKVEVVGPATINGEKVLTMRFLQGRDPDWCARPFFAEYDEEAIWLNDLKPAFGEKEFFFESELRAMFKADEQREKDRAAFEDEMLDVVN